MKTDRRMTEAEFNEHITKKLNSFKRSTRRSTLRLALTREIKQLRKQWRLTRAA